MLLVGGVMGAVDVWSTGHRIKNGGTVSIVFLCLFYLIGLQIGMSFRFWSNSHSNNLTQPVCNSAIH